MQLRWAGVQFLSWLPWGLVPRFAKVGLGSQNDVFISSNLSCFPNFEIQCKPLYIKTSFSMWRNTVDCVLLGKEIVTPPVCLFPQLEMMSRRHDKEMPPLAPFGECNLISSLSSIFSLQYMFLSISPGGLGRQKGCYPDLSV